MPNTTTSNPVAAAIERAVNTVRRTALPMNMWAGNDVEALASRVYPALRKESLKYLCELAGAIYIERHMPAWRLPGVRPPNRPGRVRAGYIPTKDTFHGTANYNAGALAAMHQRYISGPSWGGPDKTSYHHVVDHMVIIELMPWYEVAYHGGTGQSNDFWMGTEACEAQGSYGLRTLTNMAILFAAKRVKFNKPREWIVQHHAAYGKNCPGLLRRGNPVTWVQFLDMVDQYVALIYRRLSAVPPPVVDSIKFPETGKTLSGSFLNFFRVNGGVQIFGFPITERRVEKIGTWEGPVQWFERARMEDHGVVMLGLLGSEAGPKPD
jgi:hypothetical protein